MQQVLIYVYILAEMYIWISCFAWFRSLGKRASKMVRWLLRFDSAMIPLVNEACMYIILILFRFLSFSPTNNVSFVHLQESPVFFLWSTCHNIYVSRYIVDISEITFRRWIFFFNQWEYRFFLICRQRKNGTFVFEFKVFCNGFSSFILGD